MYTGNNTEKVACNSKINSVLLTLKHYKGYGNDSDFLGTHYMHPLRNDRVLVSCEDLWDILLATYRAILGFAGDSWHYNGVNDPAIKQYVLDYWKLLKTIS